MKKNLHYTLFSITFLLLAISPLEAQNKNLVLPSAVVSTPKKVDINSSECKQAKDSLLKRKERGEIGFYNTIKYNDKQYLYYNINKERYTRKYLYTGNDSPSFQACFNKGAQHFLDSMYKVDFFRKTDSILNAYDKTGRGYRNADFPGGAVALSKFLEQNIVLPNNAKADVEGQKIRVYYAFVVNEKGEISDIKMVKSNCKICEEAVLTAVNKLPKFIYATEAGVPKTVKYILPFIK